MKDKSKSVSPAQIPSLRWVWTMVAMALCSVASASGIYSFPHLSAQQTWLPPAEDDFGSIAEQDDISGDSLISLFVEPTFDSIEFQTQLFAQSDQPLRLRLTVLVDLLESDLSSRLSWRDQMAANGLKSKWTLMLGDADSAVRPAEDAIKMIHDHVGKQSHELIQLHLLVAVARQRQEDYSKSQYHLAQAMSLMHRQDGTLTDRQLPVLHQRATNLMAMDEPWKATQVLKASVRISDHSRGSRSIESTQMAMLLIRHLRNLGHYHQALSLFNTRRELLRDAEGRDTPASVALLNEGSLLHLLTFNSEVDRGLRLQQSIVDIQDQQPNLYTSEQRLRSLLRLGDWMLLFDRQRDAAKPYARAWALIEQTQTPDQWRSRLMRPELIHAGPNPSLTEIGLNQKYALQWTDFKTRIAVDGRPVKAQIIDSNLHGVVRNRALSLFRLARFRPALDEGTPVVTQTFAFRRVYDTVPRPSDVTLYQTDRRFDEYQRRVQSRHLMKSRLPNTELN